MCFPCFCFCVDVTIHGYRLDKLSPRLVPLSHLDVMFERLTPIRSLDSVIIVLLHTSLDRGGRILSSKYLWIKPIFSRSISYFVRCVRLSVLRNSNLLLVYLICALNNLDTSSIPQGHTTFCAGKIMSCF